MREKKSGLSAKGLIGGVLPALMGLLWFVILAAAFYSVFALLIVVLDLPQNLYETMALVAVLPSCFLLAYRFAKKTRRKGILIGIGFGLIVCTLLVIGCTISRSSMDLGSFLKLGIILLTCVTGGVMGVNAKYKVRL